MALPSSLRMLGVAAPMAAAVLAICSPLLAQPVTILHGTFDDFSRGQLDDGGTFTYISHDGAIRIIPSWDIDGDGHLDLMFSQDHCGVETVDMFIYWASDEGYVSLFPPFAELLPGYKLAQELERRRKYVTFLPTHGAGRLKIADLNRDGFADIVFPNTIHNYWLDMDAYIYWGSTDGFSPANRTDLPTLFAQDVDVADLNQDGFPDIVFANFGSELGATRGYQAHRESYIYWGDAAGFAAERRTSIPTVSALSCAIGDFNGDGWDDLAFANTAPQPGVYVYLGSRDGFDTAHPLLIDAEPLAVRAGDLDGDGRAELIVCTETGVNIYRGAEHFTASTPDHLPARGARDAVVADLNGDGRADIVFASSDVIEDERSTASGLPAPYAGSLIFPEERPTHHASTRSTIYWNGVDGFDAARSTQLTTLWPRAVAVADFNADGRADIIFANRGTGGNYDGPAYLYWGAEHGFHDADRTELQAYGAAGVAAADLNGDDKPDIALANQVSQRSPVPSVIFWGNPVARYSEADASLIPAVNPYGYKIADLNADGRNEIVITGLKTCIYWGSDGRSFAHQQDLGLETIDVRVHDLNHDGRLDLAFLVRGESHHVVILWNSADGFSSENRTTIMPKTRCKSDTLTIADLNRDGWLDIVFAAGWEKEKRSEIRWGRADGFANADSTFLHTNGVNAPATADLNGDGWLELIFPGAIDIDRGGDFHTESLIYWGSEHGYDDARRTGLEAYACSEIQIDDLNRDGYLDIVAGNYQSARARDIPVYIYWGNAQHAYSSDLRTELPADSSCGIQVLDLNRDDYPEIVVHNHIKDGDHHVGSVIYWGSTDGYAPQRSARLPTVGTHYSPGISPGALYDRHNAFGYTSAPLDVPAGATTLTMDCRGFMPPGTSVETYIRATPGAANWVRTTPDAPFAVTGLAQVQYRLVLTTDGGGRAPTVDDVELRFE